MCVGEGLSEILQEPLCVRVVLPLLPLSLSLLLTLLLPLLLLLLLSPSPTAPLSCSRCLLQYCLQETLFPLYLFPLPLLPLPLSLLLSAVAASARCPLPAAFPEVKSNACKRSLSSFSFELIFSLAKQKIALFKLNGRQFVVLLLLLLLNLSLQRCVSLYVCVCLCESKMKSISFFQNVFHSSQFVVVVVVVGRVKGVLSISGENSNSNNNNDE